MAETPRNIQCHAGTPVDALTGGRASGVCGRAVGYAIPCKPEVLMRALFWFYIAVILAGLAMAIVIGALGR